PLCDFFERRLDRLKPLECVSQALAGYAKVVKALLVPPFEPARQRAGFAQAGLQHSLDELVDVFDAVQIDALRLHVTA
ncbi:MAG TPA: hypothetical protein VGG70_00800, partial [Candidatus Cybelea sp.]